MQTKVEGLLISKTPYKDTNLIGKLLLRNGKKISVIFYGGRGGGTNKKSSILELGFMLHAVVRNSYKSSSELYNAKEWSLIWSHQNIRLNHKAFYLMCLFLEVISKLAPIDNLRDELASFDKESLGLFEVLSNAIYYMESSLKDQQDPRSKFIAKGQLLLFLGKLLLKQGVYPQRTSCALCGKRLEDIAYPILFPEHGGFACLSHIDPNEHPQFHSMKEGRKLINFLERVWCTKYSSFDFNHNFGANFDFDSQDSSKIVSTLFHYLCYQFHFKESDFKSLSLVI